MYHAQCTLGSTHVTTCQCYNTTVNGLMSDCPKQTLVKAEHITHHKLPFPSVLSLSALRRFRLYKYSPKPGLHTRVARNKMMYPMALCHSVATACFHPGLQMASKGYSSQ